jgi:hypothetical protein
VASNLRRPDLLDRVIGNYVICQHLFAHLQPVDISNTIYAMQIGQEMGPNELTRHLHPLRYVFEDAEIEILSKRIDEGYAIVLWGRDLKQLVEMIDRPYSYRRTHFFFRPNLRTHPPLRLAITDFAPPTVPFAKKPDLPGFDPNPRLPFSKTIKPKCPAEHFELTHHKSTITWDGKMTALPMVPYIPQSDDNKIAELVSYEWSQALHYVNLHESPLKLKTCHGREHRHTHHCVFTGRTWDTVAYGFEAWMKSRTTNASIADSMTDLNLGS